MYKALVIGCGNIGALYDLADKRILTHTKAYCLNSKFKVWVYDRDIKKASEVARKYKIPFLERLPDIELKKFDFVSVCTPTDQHAGLIMRLLKLRTKMILCEKPIAGTIAELEALKKEYAKGHSKVLVNYIRQFQPTFRQVKQYLENNCPESYPENIIIKYQRGFLNNGSHAFDTLNFLLREKTVLKKSNCILKVPDLDPRDPTITCNTKYNTSDLSLTGITNTGYTLFEIELYFSNSMLLIKKSGNSIEYYSFNKRKQAVLKKTWSGGLNDYMKHVLTAGIEMHNRKRKDNFYEALALNKTLLQFSK